MLDFYWLMDTEEMPEYPDEDRYIGGLGYKQADVMICVWQQCACEMYPNRGEIFFDGGWDFVLRSHEIKKLLAICTDCRADITNKRIVKHYTNFITLLEQAIQEENRGLAAYCD